MLLSNQQSRRKIPHPIAKQRIGLRALAQVVDLRLDFVFHNNLACLGNAGTERGARRVVGNREAGE